MVRLRLFRIGRKKYPVFLIVAMDARRCNFLEKLGSLDRNRSPSLLQIKRDRIMYWLSVGAQPTDSVKSILSKSGILLERHLLEGVKKKAITKAISKSRLQKWYEQHGKKRLKSQFSSFTGGDFDPFSVKDSVQESVEAVN